MLMVSRNVLKCMSPSGCPVQLSIFRQSSAKPPTGVVFKMLGKGPGIKLSVIVPAFQAQGSEFDPWDQNKQMNNQTERLKTC